MCVRLNVPVGVSPCLLCLPHCTITPLPSYLSMPTYLTKSANSCVSADDAVITFLYSFFNGVPAQ